MEFRLEPLSRTSKKFYLGSDSPIPWHRYSGTLCKWLTEETISICLSDVSFEIYWSRHLSCHQLSTNSSPYLARVQASRFLAGAEHVPCELPGAEPVRAVGQGKHGHICLELYIQREIHYSQTNIMKIQMIICSILTDRCIFERKSF